MAETGYVSGPKPKPPHGLRVAVAVRFCKPELGWRSLSVYSIMLKKLILLPRSSPTHRCGDSDE
jgi:hypothetical protein